MSAVVIVFAFDVSLEFASNKLVDDVYSGVTNPIV